MTAEDINDTIYVIVDCRVGICPLISINKCDDTDTVAYGAAEVRFNLHNALNDRSAEHNVLGISLQGYVLENNGNISNRSFSCIVSSISGTVT